ncbi:hypothetical protein JJQ59_15170 [Cupriavidus necator]|uniref:hypothetical protein n=1 Tax=Cupriavidus necator TaxID=106590 RepID=UPI0016761B76|nr:hypothetical protein [Cupriavidus necator]QQX83742.1 hypothetical protein JJQ59_15170 [Cupriavidus necator]
MPFPEAQELNEVIAEAARLAVETAGDGSTVPSPSTLAARGSKLGLPLIAW